MSKTSRAVVAPPSSESAAEDLLRLGTDHFRTVLADPPWRFQNRTGKMAPEHRRLSRYGTMPLDEIMELPVAQIVQDRAHLYLWVPNALILEGLEVMRRWDEQYHLIERCSPGPYLEMFARHYRKGWEQWGNESPAAEPKFELKLL